MAWLKRLLGFAALLLVFCFAALAVNQDSLALRFLDFETAAISVYWWLLLAFAAGLLLGMALTALAGLRTAAENRRLRQRLDAAEEASSS